MFIEQILEAERTEQQYLEHQIEDFELWEESNRLTTTPDAEVICPICQTSNLSVVADPDERVRVACSDVSCPCRLDVSTMMTDEPLQHLREKLRLTLEDHSRKCDCFLLSV